MEIAIYYEQINHNVEEHEKTEWKKKKILKIHTARNTLRLRNITANKNISAADADGVDYSNPFNRDTGFRRFNSFLCVGYGTSF